MVSLEENTHIHQYMGYKGNLSFVYIICKLVTLRTIFAYVCILDFFHDFLFLWVVILGFVLCFVCCQTAVKQGNVAHSYMLVGLKWEMVTMHHSYVFYVFLRPKAEVLLCFFYKISEWF